MVYVHVHVHDIVCMWHCVHARVCVHVPSSVTKAPVRIVAIMCHALMWPSARFSLPHQEWASHARKRFIHVRMRKLRLHVCMCMRARHML
jgi:hypothetical protein